MKKRGNSKRILAVLCAVAMVITMFPTSLMLGGVSFAEDETGTEVTEPVNGAAETGEEKTPVQEDKEVSEPEKKADETAESEASSEKTVPDAVDEKKPEVSDNDKTGEKTEAATEEKKDVSNDNKADNKDGKKEEEKVEGYKVEFDFGDNYARFNPINPKTTDKDGKIELPEKPKARDEVYKAEDGKEYYFTGWKYKDKEYEPGEAVTIKGDAKFKAVWMQTYTIKFSAKGIEADKVEPQIEVYGEDVVLPEETASEEGLDFIGWTPDNGETVYDAGTKIAAKSIQPASRSASAAVVKLRGVSGDETKPVIDIKYVSKDESSATLSVAATDASGIKSLVYQITDNELVKPETIEAGWTDVPENGQVTVQNTKYLTVKATDNSDNENVSTKSMHVDLSSMEQVQPTVEITSADPAADTFSKSHTLTFTVSDDSSIEDIRVYVGDETLPAYTLSSDATSVKVEKKSDGTYINGSQTIKIEATDKWGNKGSDSINCKFDNEKPTINEFIMTGQASEDGFFNASNCGIKATATDNDEGSGIKSITVKTTVSGSEKTVGSVENGELNLDAATVANILGAIESDLTLTALVEDKAGNTDEKTLTIKYDAVAPMLSDVKTDKDVEHSYDGDKKYKEYSDAASTEYKVEELNLKSLSLTYNYKEYDSEQAAEQPGEVVADVSTKTVTGEWKKDGIYKDIKVYAIDKAGNKLEIKSGLDLSKEGGASSENGTVSFSYGKLINLIEPKAYVYYDTGISGVTNEKAKMYIYEESGIIKAYVSGPVTATKVRIEDKWLLLHTWRYTWQTADGTIQPISLGEIEWDADKKTSYAEINNIPVITEEGEKKYKISGGMALFNQLKVIERTELGTEVIEKTGNWPPETSNATTTQVHFVMDKTCPAYVSKEFTTVRDEKENLETAGSEYTAYYGKSAVESLSDGKEGIKGKFTITDANLDTDAATTGAMAVKADESGGVVRYNQIDAAWPVTQGSDNTPVVVDNDYTYEVNASEDGVYRFIVFGEDKAGNKLVKTEDITTADYNTTKPYQMNPDENTGKFWSMKKVLDTKAPGFGLKMSDSVSGEAGYYVQYKNITTAFDGWAQDGEYNPFRKNDTANVIVRGQDESPVKINYSIISSSPDGAEWTEEGPFQGDYSNDQSVPAKKDGETQFRVTNLTVIDKAGNSAITNQDGTVKPYESNTVYLDGSKPEKDIIKPVATIKSTSKVTKRVMDSDVFKDDVNIVFSIEDPNEHKSSSGLKTAHYSIIVDGKTIVDNEKLQPAKVNGVENQTWINDESADNSNAGKNKNNTVGEDRGDEGLCYKVSMNKLFEKGGKYETNNIKILLSAEDNSGNSVETDYTFGIDSKGPEVVVSYDNNSVQNGKYFKANRTATVTVKERNLGTESNKIVIKTQTGVPSSWGYKAGSPVSGNDDIWTKQLHYTKDGDYTLDVTGTDALGNDATVKYEGTAPRDFVIDKTAPTLKVTFDNNSVRNKKYYNANRTATVSINEHNFRASDVKVDGKASGPRKTGLGFPSMGKFSSSGDSRAARIPFTKEGNFSFSVDYTDLAGNPAKKVVIDEFVIDKTAPVVKIENVINGGIYGGTVAPKAIFDDDNFSKADSSFRFTGVRIVNRDSLIPAFRANGEYGGSYEMSDFPKVRANDDIYTAYATSTDMAGNTTTVQVVFSVNRFGSTFDYNGDETTINLVSKENGRYYTNVAEALEIREINVNPITKYELTLDRGGNSSTLKEGTDYTVAKGSSDQGSTYVYKINKDIVTDEGSYNIVVKSEDAAGNINTNAAIRSEEDSEEVPVRFVYDVTAPTMSFTNIGDGNSVIELKTDGSTRFSGINILDLGIVPDDDWALGSIQYVLTDRDGTIHDTGVIKGDEFWKVMGEDGLKRFEQEIEHGSNTKSLTVTVWDAAGNETSQKYDLLVTSNALEVAAHYWYIVLLVLAALGGAYAYYRKRKKDSEESEAA